MSAYVIVEADVTDTEQYEQYMAASPAAVAAGGGRFIARGGETVALEGGWEPKRVVVLEFPDIETVERWYHSDGYQAVKKLREGAADFRAIAVAGTDAP